MALLEGKTAAERKKLIVAVALGAVALISLAYMFLGSSSKTSQTVAKTTTTSKSTPVQAAQVAGRIEPEPFIPQVIPTGMTQPAVPEAGRNIFAFYVPPPAPTPDPNKTPPPPSPTPTPTPPNLILSSISPVNVYAHTGDFTLDVTGDKFTPETRIYMGGAELPTRYVSPQQLSTKVPAQLISFEGGREVKVQSRDGQFFSNTATLNVMPAPAPNFILIGVITRTGSNDTAILKQKNGSDLLNVQRGDIVGGRFRVTSISVREVTLLDTSIQIKHKLPLVSDNSGTLGQPRTPPPPQPSDEEPEP